MKNLLLALVVAAAFSSCTKKDEKQKLWIYTSLYKDTIADIQPKLTAQFPDVEFQFYQAGSEEVAAKVQTEALAGGIQADILISSDRFWYEEMAAKSNLVTYRPSNTDKVDDFFKHPDGFYTTLSYPVMVIAYNTDSVSTADAPKTFKELTDAKWKDKVSVGSPLASGTSFTTVAFLVKKYGWEYFTQLKKNNLIAEGGNSGVIRRLQSKERPVGIVLLENVLRLTASDPRIKFIIPEDGAIVQSNVLAIVDRKTQDTDKKTETKKKVADWMFGEEGQKAMARSYMYPSVRGFEPPTGAPDFKLITATAKPWTREFITETMQGRDQLKDQFTKTMF